MLCGLISPSTGDAFIRGSSLVANSALTTSVVGLCPQENIVWTELTVYENVLLYARLKYKVNRPAIGEKASVGDERRMTPEDETAHILQLGECCARYCVCGD